MTSVYTAGPQMDASQETYFWMVDRLGLDDDPRNKVNMQTNTVICSKPLQQKLSNGYYLAKLLQNMQLTYENRTGNKVVLDNNKLNSIKEESKPYQQQAWKIIFDELEKFNLLYDNSKRDSLVKTQSGPQVLDILNNLFDIDNSPTGERQSVVSSIKNTETKQKTLKPSASPRSNASALKSPNNADSLSAKRNSVDHDSAKGSSSVNKKGMKSQIGQNSAIKNRRSSQAVTQRKNLPPLSSAMSPRKGQQLLSPGNKRDLGALAGQNSNQDLKTMDDTRDLFGELEESIATLPNTLAETKTSIQFVIMSLCIAFELKPKQAFALLSNNQKYLMHICVKGGKGKNFEPVLNWYGTMYQQISHLINLIVLEKKEALLHGGIVQPSNLVQPTNRRGQPPQTQRLSSDQGLNLGGPASESQTKILFKNLNIFKAGFYSRNEMVVMTTATFLIRLINEINDIGGEIVGDAWDWFVTSTYTPEKPSKSKDALMQATLRQLRELGIQDNDGAIAKDIVSEQMEQMQAQTGVQGVIYAFSRNQEMLENMSSLLLLFGRFNAVELFTQKLQLLLATWSDYTSVCNDLLLCTLNSPLAHELIDQSGVLAYWVMASLKVAESTSEVPLNDRVISLVFITDIWIHKPQFLARNLEGAPEAILSIMKRAARDVLHTLSTTSIELMFRLLESFAKNRNNFAPTVYKTLTFLLIEFYWEVEVRELMIRHFIYVFKNFEAIPIKILCEPLLKQIEISQYHAASFNVFDFEFFETVARHSKLNVSTAILLMDAISKVAMTSVYFQKQSIKLLREICQKFFGEKEVFNHWRDSFRHILGSLVNMQTKLVIHRHHLRQEETNFFNRLALRNQTKKKEVVDPSGGRMTDSEYQQLLLNERLLVNLLQHIIHIGNTNMNNELKTQLLDTHTQIQKSLKFDCRATRYLIKMFSQNVDELVFDRMDKNPTAHQQIPMPYLQELEALQAQGSIGDQKEDNPNGAEDVGVSNQVNTLSPAKMLTMKKGSSIQKLAPGQSLPVGASIDLSANPGRMIQASPMLQIESGEKKPKEMPQVLYDQKQYEEEWEILQYQQHLKKHDRFYKRLLHAYTNDMSAKKPTAVHKKTFDEKEAAIEIIHVQSLVKMIKDFKLENGLSHAILKEQTMRLVKAINQFILKAERDLLSLDYEGFKHFLLQYSYFLWGGDNKRAYALVEKLIKQMRESPLFAKLGLSITKTEANPRPEIKLLEEMAAKAKKDANYKVPQGYKIVKETHKFVDHRVPLHLPIRESKRVATELMDSVLFKALGFHFLEPIAVEQPNLKVVPDIVSRRQIIHNTGKFTPSFVNKLSSEQAELKKQFDKKEKIAKELTKRNSASVIVPLSLNQDERRQQFKLQALNRRAAQFGQALQLAVIETEEIEEKQHLFQCAEMLDAVLKAVVSGKKSLHLDTTPYVMLQREAKPSKFNSKPENDIKEEDKESGSMDPEVLAEAKRLKREKINNFMGRLHKNEQKKAEQKAELDEQLGLNDKEDQEARRKAAHEEYEAQREEKMEEIKALREEEEEEKEREKEEKKQKDKDEREKRREEASYRDEEYAQQLKEKYQKKNADKAQKVKAKEGRREMLIAQAREANKDRAEQLQEAKEKREQMRGQYIEFMKEPAVAELLNNSYNEGLHVKYSIFCRHSKSVSGVTLKGWSDYFLEHHLAHVVISKTDLGAIFTSSVNEQKELIREYKTLFKTDSLRKPEVGEIGIAAFVSAILKVAIISKDTRKNIPAGAQKRLTNKTVTARGMSAKRSPTSAQAQVRKAPTILQPHLDVKEEVQGDQIGEELWKVYDTTGFTEKDIERFFNAIEIKKDLEHVEGVPTIKEVFVGTNKEALATYKKNSLAVRKDERSPPPQKSPKQALAPTQKKPQTLQSLKIQDQGESSPSPMARQRTKSGVSGV